MSAGVKISAKDLETLNAEVIILIGRLFALRKNSSKAQLRATAPVENIEILQPAEEKVCKCVGKCDYAHIK